MVQNMFHSTDMVYYRDIQGFGTIKYNVLYNTCYKPCYITCIYGFMTGHVA